MATVKQETFEVKGNVREETQTHGSKVISLFKEKHDLNLSPLETMIQLRLSGLSLPALLTLAIVDSNSHAKCPMIFVGEVEAFYMSHFKAGKNQSRWTYSAIARMLRVLHLKGLLNRDREGRYVAYGMSRKGIKLLEELGLSL